MSDSTASAASISIDPSEMCPVLVVSSYRVVPARMKKKEGGATPRNVPQKKGDILTPTMGEARLMNQLGRNGVIRRKMMYHIMSLL